MAIWVNVNRVAKFPEVNTVYNRAGRGQGSTQGAGGTTPASAAKGFLMTVKRAVSESAGAALPSWIRKAPGIESQDWQTCQVDVTTIPGVRALNVNGKWNKFVA